MKKLLSTLILGLIPFFLLAQVGHLMQGIGAHNMSMGGAATGMAMSFATTHALGQVAKRYYAGGRVMSTALLQDTFQQLLAPAKQMQVQYLPQMKELSRTLDMGKVLGMVRGGQ